MKVHIMEIFNAGKRLKRPYYAMVTTAMRPSRDFRASNASRTEVARRSNRSRGVAVVTAPLEHHFTLNIEQAIERLSESSIRTWDVNIVEFFVQRIKSSNGTNSCKMNNTHWSYVYIVALLWSTSDMTYAVDQKSRYIETTITLKVGHRFPSNSTSSLINECLTA